MVWDIYNGSIGPPTERTMDLIGGSGTFQETEYFLGIVGGESLRVTVCKHGHDSASTFGLLSPFLPFLTDLLVSDLPILNLALLGTTEDAHICNKVKVRQGEKEKLNQSV